MTNGNQAGTTNNRAGSSKTAIFETKYIKSLQSIGWLRVLIEPSGQSAYLCEYTKVIIQKKEKGRTYFLIKEGRYAGKSGSLSDNNAAKCLVSFKRGSGATLTVIKQGRKRERSNIRKKVINQLFATLYFNGQTARITIDSAVKRYTETNRNSPDYGQEKDSKPLPDGTYKIMTPFTAGNKDFTSFYRTEPNGYAGLRYDTVWFPIEYAPTYNSNFIHVGHLSEGCITCYEIQKWNDLYQYLITNRSDKDGKYIGTLIIK